MSSHTISRASTDDDVSGRERSVLKDTKDSAKMASNCMTAEILLFNSLSCFLQAAFPFAKSMPRIFYMPEW